VFALALLDCPKQSTASNDKSRREKWTKQFLLRGRVNQHLAKILDRVVRECRFRFVTRLQFIDHLIDQLLNAVRVFGIEYQGHVFRFLLVHFISLISAHR
jgi:hypothetical protein